MSVSEHPLEESFGPLHERLGALADRFVQLHETEMYSAGGFWRTLGVLAGDGVLAVLRHREHFESQPMETDGGFWRNLLFLCVSVGELSLSRGWRVNSPEAELSMLLSALVSISDFTALQGGGIMHHGEAALSTILRVGGTESLYRFVLEQAGASRSPRITGSVLRAVLEARSAPPPLSLA